MRIKLGPAFGGRPSWRRLALAACLLLLPNAPAPAQIHISEAKSPASTSLNRDRALDMLGEIKEVLKNEYYDKGLRGIDLDQSFKAAAAKIKQLDSNWQMFPVIAQLLLEFNDSHTRFIPPARSDSVEYGLSLQMVGDTCYVVDVKKGSDAESQGVRVGDVALKIGQHPLNRDDLWRINYLIYQLAPRPDLPVTLRGPDGGERRLVLKASFKSLEERRKEARKRRDALKQSPFKCVALGADVAACKLYTFETDKGQVDKMMKEVGQRRRLILDLRGNRGGYVATEIHLTGYFFDREVKIGDEVGREKKKERFAKPHRGKVFGGELTVLVDSHSASAAEVFARVVQLEKRGKIVGDVSAGAVMTSRRYSMAHRRGGWSFQTYSFYGVSVTVGDLVMSDGQRLEGRGVVPDVPVGPTAGALSRGEDPVLAYAAHLFGAPVGADEAGKFYFLTKKPEDEDGEKDDEGEDR